MQAYPHMNTHLGLYDFEVVKNEPVGDALQRIVIASPELASTIVPGQFVNIAVPGDARHITRIPLSYSASDAKNGIVEIVYAIVGEGTRRLAAMKPQQTSDLVGPSGNGWQISAARDTGRVLLVAGGVGITPIVGLAHELQARGRAFDVVIGAQTKARLWGVTQSRDAGAGRVMITTDDGSCGTRGFTTTAAEELLKQQGYDCVYTCGPAPMMAAIARIAKSYHTDCQVSLERMMACGFGACHVCNVAMIAGGYKRCCTEGPVFDAEEVVW